MPAVIISALNARDSLSELLPQVADAAERLVISDGGSDDDTLAVSLSHGAVLALGTAGRGRQLSRGAAWSAECDWLLFLHSDSRLVETWPEAVSRHINTHPEKAACFDLRFDSRHWQARIVEGLVWVRSRILGLPYGDQGLLISRALYDRIGGYADMDLFEDVDIIRRLGRRRIRSLRTHIMTSAAKYERDGFFKRGWANLKLLRRYWKGEDISCLIRDYT
ncbi:MAG: TIGR04283 family arsenosugar biosynthesis glycosyltransferase [Hyphomonadaceae bacterium]|nr:TIGR04283 family arsenosugar biosynthesis glycosyltransferase [Hyphomonadaceae bacterium]